MNLRTSLGLRQHQTLALSPKLRQSIALLQLPSLELEQAIQLELEKNPFLEIESYSVNSFIFSPSISSSESVYHHNHLTSSHTHTPNHKYNNKEDHYDFIDQYHNPNSISLKQHLLSQLQLLPLSNKEKILAYAIIDDIDDNGYLQSSLKEIHHHLLNNLLVSNVSVNNLSENIESSILQNDVLSRHENKKSDFYEELTYENLTKIEESELEFMLLRIQDFDPAGIAARNLSECLTIQLAGLPKSTPQLEILQTLVLNYLELLAEKDYSAVKKILKLNDNELAEVLRLLKQLDPKPGSHISAKHLDYIIPDVFVRNQNNKLVVELNMANIPNLRINKEYKSLLTTRNFANKTPLKHYLSDAEWFLKSIQTRNVTLLRVCHSIVAKQEQFFKYGEEQLKPLSLQEIASEAGYHESTVSRITQQKIMQTPRGTFELRYFFSNPISKKKKYVEKDSDNHLSNSNSSCYSSNSVRAQIKKIIQDETVPLSDLEICKILSDRGITINRRTLAKYRIALKIPPSHARKRNQNKAEILCKLKNCNSSRKALKNLKFT